MYNYFAKKIVNEIITADSVDESNKEIYVYGFEILISSIAYLLVFTGIGLISNTLLSSYVFLLGFYVIRSCCGGIHATTYRMCHVAFTLNHVLFILFNNYFPDSCKNIFEVIVPIYTIIATFMFAPVDNESKKFTNNEYVHFKTKSRITSIIIFFIFETMYFMGINNFIISSCLFGIFSAITSMILAYLMQKYNIKKVKEEG